jgi:hypothetical protein
MRMLWRFHRRLFVIVIVVVVLAISIAAVLTGSHYGPRAAVPISGRRSATTRATKLHKPTVSAHHISPTSTRFVPQTALQREIDAELARSEPPAAIAAALGITVPAPAVSTAYPAIPMADRSDPGAYVIAFASELLDTNYALQTRAGLLGWVEHEEAPNTLPGVPATVAGKALVLSLADPDLPGGSPSPVPSMAQWAADDQSDVSQTVSDVQAEVDPDWTEIVSEGWQPHDPLMTIEVVTGTLTVETNGVAAAPESFSLTLTLGSAAPVRPGYGAVAAADWTLG